MELSSHLLLAAHEPGGDAVAVSGGGLPLHLQVRARRHLPHGYTDHVLLFLSSVLLFNHPSLVSLALTYDSCSRFSSHPASADRGAADAAAAPSAGTTSRATATKVTTTLTTTTQAMTTTTTRMPTGASARYGPRSGPGRSGATIREPSRGGTGIRLNRKRRRLKNAPWRRAPERMLSALCPVELR